MTLHSLVPPRLEPSEGEAVLNEVNRPALEYRRQFWRGRGGKRGVEKKEENCMHVCVLLEKTSQHNQNCHCRNTWGVSGGNRPTFSSLWGLSTFALASFISVP